MAKKSVLLYLFFSDHQFGKNRTRPVSKVRTVVENSAKVMQMSDFSHLSHEIATNREKWRKIVYYGGVFFARSPIRQK